MGLLATAEEFIRLTDEEKYGKLTDNYYLQSMVESLRSNRGKAICISLEKDLLEYLLKLGVDNKEFIKYLEEDIIENIEYSFLPSGFDKVDKMCLCSMLVRNEYKIIGTFVCRNGKFSSIAMKIRAYNDALDKLKTLEYYRLMNDRYFSNNDLQSTIDQIELIEHNIIKLIKINDPTIGIDY